MTNQSQTDLVLGTALWGWTVPESTCFQLLDDYYEEGFREVDIATNYPINKRPSDFRKSEQILLQWIKSNGITDLRIIAKVGSINNLGGPENNLTKSFLLICLDEYRYLFEKNLATFMIHWDNRKDSAIVNDSAEVLTSVSAFGLTPGLSGIRHPEVYARISERCDLKPWIQFKHNLLYSDFDRYAPLHPYGRFIAYGINAGGIKLNPKHYSTKSSLAVRGGDTAGHHPLAGKLEEAIRDWNRKKGQQLLSNFNHCGMTFAFYHPGIARILIGPSKAQQLKESIRFFEHLKEGLISDFYSQLVKIHENYVATQ